MSLCERDRYLPVAEADPVFRDGVLEGLSRRPRAIPARWLYDRSGSELKGSVPVDAFRHLVRWNEAEARIEKHLVAARDVHFAVEERHFSIAEGETIHTENSFKYRPREAVCFCGLGAGPQSRIGPTTMVCSQ